MNLKKAKVAKRQTHVKLINENTALAPVGSNVVFRLGEGPSTERRTVCSMFGSRLVVEKRLKHANGPSTFSSCS